MAPREIANIVASAATFDPRNDASHDENLMGRSVMKERKEIHYDGHYYDVTDFVGRHPGGPVIKFYCDKKEDATQAVQQFHHLSRDKVLLMLKSFKRRPATDRSGKASIL